jgi:hypothetical protein
MVSKARVEVGTVAPGERFLGRDWMVWPAAGPACKHNSEMDLGSGIPHSYSGDSTEWWSGPLSRPTTLLHLANSLYSMHLAIGWALGQPQPLRSQVHPNTFQNGH